MKRFTFVSKKMKHFTYVSKSVLYFYYLIIVLLDKTMTK